MRIKKLLICVMAVLLLSVAAVFAGCGDPGNESDNNKEPAKTQYTVTFVVDGGTAPAAQTVAEGGKATRPEDPVKTATSHTTEYMFGGWFTKDGETETEWNFFEDAVTKNVTLYAKFTEEQVSTPNYGKN